MARARVSVSYFSQSAELKDLRALGLMDAAASAHSQRDALRQIDRAFAAFYRRVRAGEKPGYPRYRSRSRYDSLTWYQGFKVRPDGRLAVQAVGPLRVRWHRPLPEGSKVKTLGIKRSAGRWFATFALEMPSPASVTATIGGAVGVDLGILSFAALSTGETVAGPRAFRAAARDLRIAQRRIARRQRGSVRRKKAVAIAARRYERVSNVRRDHARKLAARLCKQYDAIFVEDLNIRGLARGVLAKDVHDQGWRLFLKVLHDKAEWAGRDLILVDPRWTSQLCSECDELVPKTLAARVHNCACGYVADRDVNAARNILKRGLGSSLQAPTVGEEVHAVA